MKNTKFLAPSILSADFANLEKEIKMLDEANCEYIHVDVMDGHFVPNITLGPPIVKSLRNHTNRIFDVHLMMDSPDAFLKDFCSAGADILTVHEEACIHLHRTLQNIKELGCKAGVALNPGTNISTIEYVLEEVDMVLIMTVNPGFGGQAFIPSTLRKIEALSKMRSEKKLQFDIQVDGGINLSTLPLVLEAGANVIVTGSTIFNAEEPKKMIKDFKLQFEKY